MANVCAQSTDYPLSLSFPRKKVWLETVRFTDHLNMTRAVDWDFKPQTKQKQKSYFVPYNPYSDRSVTIDFLISAQV